MSAIFVASLLLVSAQAGTFDGFAIDPEFNTGHSVKSLADVPNELAPDQVQTSPLQSGGLELRVLLENAQSTRFPVEALSFTQSGNARRVAVTGADGVARLADCGAPGSQLKLVASLDADKFSVTDGSRAYRVVVEATCGSQVQALFRPETNGGQALGIFRIAQLGKKKLEAAVGLSFWSSKMQFVWPADGDYYSFGSVHITKGQQWDVVGHEMGHAIYDLADLGGFGGGPHKIDECYSDALALSEGWASYFSGWLSVGLDDADAKFEYMVPRRAPIRFEHVPADVCNGPKNEWRVNAFFWDLIDLNADGEETAESFARLWQPLLNSRVGTASAAALKLERAGVSRELLNLVWELNFRTPRR